MNRQELFDLHAKLSAKALEIMKAKNADYAGKSGESPFGNFERSEVLGIPRELGLMLRVMDKFCRIKTFIESGTLAVKGEPVDDAILDIINYMVLLQGMVEENRGDESAYSKLAAETNAVRSPGGEHKEVRVERYKIASAAITGADDVVYNTPPTWLPGQQDLRAEWDLDETSRSAP